MYKTRYKERRETIEGQERMVSSSIQVFFRFNQETEPRNRKGVRERIKETKKSLDSGVCSYRFPLRLNLYEATYRFEGNKPSVQEKWSKSRLDGIEEYILTGEGVLPLE